MAIAVQSDPNDIQELKSIFQALDRDGNGSISLEELQHGLGERENGEQLISILRGADTDNSGTINYTGKYKFLSQSLSHSVKGSTLLVMFRVFGGNDGRDDLPP